MKKMEEIHRLIDYFPDMPAFGGVAGPMSTAISLRPIELVLRDMKKKAGTITSLARVLCICQFKVGENLK